MFQIRQELLTTQPSAHGAIDYQELAKQGIAPDDVIDFSENSNPYGPSPAVRAAIINANPARYPDRDCLALRQALADHEGCTPDSIMVGNGAAELIWLLGFAFIQPHDPVLIVGPTFGEYERTVRLMNGQVIAWRSQASDNFQLDVTALSQALKTHNPRLFFLCNPNNPTGVVTELSTIEMWARTYPQTLFVIDEAYIDFVPEMVSAYTLDLPNILILRSMTKAYALAGLRLGYALGPQRLIAALAQVQTPYLQETLQRLAEAKCVFCDALAKLGWTAPPSATHYQLLQVGERASQFRARLLPHGLLVRDCASFGLADTIRVATRRPAENQRLIQLLSSAEFGGAGDLPFS